MENKIENLDSKSIDSFVLTLNVAKSTVDRYRETLYSFINFFNNNEFDSFDSYIENYLLQFENEKYKKSMSIIINKYKTFLENKSANILYLVNVSYGYEGVATEGAYLDIDLAKSHLEKVDFFINWAGIQEVEINKPIDKPNHGYIYKRTVDGIIEWDKTSHIEF